MNPIQFNVPTGWTFQDGLASSSDGNLHVDVSWTPQDHPEGYYACRVIQDGSQTNYFETDDPVAAKTWLESQFATVS